MNTIIYISEITSKTKTQPELTIELNMDINTNIVILEFN